MSWGEVPRAVTEIRTWVQVGKWSPKSWRECRSERGKKPIKGFLMKNYWCGHWDPLSLRNYDRLLSQPIGRKLGIYSPSPPSSFGWRLLSGAFTSQHFWLVSHRAESQLCRRMSLVCRGERWGALDRAPREPATVCFYRWPLPPPHQDSDVQSRVGDCWAGALWQGAWTLLEMVIMRWIQNNLVQSPVFMGLSCFCTYCKHRRGFPFSWIPCQGCV